MENIEFKVSAKAARLIGRENITDSEGAVIELVKNSYDADAECVLLIFDMKYPSIPNILNESDLLLFSKEDRNTICDLYYVKNEDNGSWERTVFDDKSIEDLSAIFFKKNTIVVMDNGDGMTKDIVSNAWMHIGTSYKETNFVSRKGRVKTGAKGIGRFALDKLSCYSKMITKTNDSNLVLWEIDWEQFTSAKLLNQIQAHMEETEESFEDYVKKISGPYYDNIKGYNWESGTIIILSPLREAWNQKQFIKINNAIMSLNPFGTVDKFCVFVDNRWDDRYSFKTEDLDVSQDDYDYKVSSSFNGEFELTVEINRNEIDTELNRFEYKYTDEYCKELSMADFWSKQSKEGERYTKENYNTPGILKFDLREILDRNDLITLNTLGKFHFSFIFSKLQNNADYYPIIQRIPQRKRNRLYKTFSGIKIYRDEFKVRPYGERDSALYDWLDFGGRSQRSPAPVSHASGKWRVLPYQTLGNVLISREDNLYLSDMANREGLVRNDQYELLVKLCVFVVSIFENDRQFFYRKISEWIDSNDTRGTEKIIENIVSEEKSSKGKGSSEEQNNGKEYSKTEYRDAVLHLVKKAENQEDLLEILMAFCASGILTNTFAHEFKQIETSFGTRDTQLKLCLDYIFGEKGFIGDDDFNPYYILEENERQDLLLSSWIGILMDGINHKINHNDIDNYNLVEVLNDIITIWKPLLSKKYVNVLDIDSAEILCDIPQINWYIVLNNFILNSVWFLEHDNEEKKKVISISLEESDEGVIVHLFNNGPSIDEKYKDVPNLIFNAGESSKDLGEGKKGTGIGLWISHTVLANNQCEIYVSNVKDGFGLDILIPRRR